MSATALMGSTEDICDSAKLTTFSKCFRNLVHHRHANEEDMSLSAWPKQYINMTSDHFKHIDNIVC